MSFRLHGNYCGPGWSAGKWQTSVVSDVKPTDAFDATCKEHDAAYATGEDLRSADLRFARQNILSLNPLQVFAGVGVGLQGLGRTIGVLPSHAGGEISDSTTIPTEEKFQPVEKFEMPVSKSIRRRRNKILAKIEQVGQTINNQRSPTMEVVNRQRSRLARAFAPVQVTPAPVSIGNTLTASQPRIVATRNGARVMCREFLTVVKNPLASSSYQVAAIAPLHPMYYNGTVMANTARGYSLYRFNKVVVHFVTRQSTAQAGEVVLAYSENVLEPLENGNGANFLSRVMTKGSAIIGPVWQNHTMNVVTDTKFRKVDAFNAADFNDNIAGEIQAYSQALTTDDLGYLIIDYDLEFQTTMFTPHGSSLPLPGAGAYVNINVNTATTALGGAVFSNLVGFPATQYGTIYRFVLDADNSLFGLRNKGTCLSYSTEYETAAGTETKAGSSLIVDDGAVFYVVTVQGLAILYTSIEAALTGSGSGQVLWRNTDIAAVISLYGTAYIVRLNPAELTLAD